MKNTFLSILFSIMLQGTLLSIDSELSILDATERGYKAYLSSLSEQKKEIKQTKMNEAIQYYLEAAQKKPLAEVFANIGILHFYLGDPGLALYYLTKAQKLEPRNSEIHTIYLSILDILELSDRVLPKSYIERISCSSSLSFSEKNAIMIALAFLSCTLFSCSLWLSSYGIRIIFYICISTISLFSTFFYILPFLVEDPKAIVQSPTSLKGSFDEKIISNNLLSLLPGEEVIVLDSNQKENWLRVKTARGVIGYISGKNVRMI